MKRVNIHSYLVGKSLLVKELWICEGEAFKVCLVDGFD